jgi:hypothetical protein
MVTLSSSKITPNVTSMLSSSQITPNLNMNFIILLDDNIDVDLTFDVINWLDDRYVVCLLNSRKTLIKIKQLKIEPRLFLAFFSVGPGDIRVFFSALSLSPERLGDVRRCAIFHTPSSSFWEAC